MGLGRVLIVGIVLSLGLILGIAHYWKEGQSLDAKDYFLLTIEQRKNVNIVFYKDGCPYCEAAKEPLREESKESEVPTFFVNIETKEGQELKKSFGVKYAATLVVIRDGKQQELIYAEKKNGQYQAKIAQIRQLLELSTSVRSPYVK